MIFSRRTALHFFLPLLLLCAVRSSAQLCAGSLGDPVVHITFGAGSNPGPATNNNNYNFQSSDCPDDGEYTVVNGTSSCFANTWHSLNSDHTGDANGYFMLINASFQPGDFYLGKASGLCGNTTYEFAAWIVNVLRPFSCGSNGIKPNLTFSIETTSGTVLASYDTKDIASAERPEWKQYGMFFTTPAGTSEVVVRLRNNAPGGCGNDLALDDITFRPCGARIDAQIDGVPSGKAAQCASDKTTYRFSATVTTTYLQPQYQWQESSDSGATWHDLAGATTTNYTWTPRPAANYLYRMVVAEQGNIGSAACRIASTPLQIDVHPAPTVRIDSIPPLCANQPLLIKANVNFYNSGAGPLQWEMPTGANLSFQQSDSLSYVLISGSTATGFAGQYILNATSAAGCAAADTTAVQLLERPVASIAFPALVCAGSAATLTGSATLNAGAITAWQWAWNGSTANAQNITPLFQDAGTYPISLSVTAANGCTSEVTTSELPVKPTPVAAFAMPEVCLTDPFAQFENNSSVLGGERLSYTWNFGDPNNPAAGATSENPQYRYGKTGVFGVRLAVTSASGCVADTVQQFTVNGSSPKALFAVEGNTLLCSADSVLLRNAATVDFGNITKVVIRWKNDNDPQARTEDENPVVGKTYAFAYAPYVTGTTQKFTVHYTVYSGMGCMDEAFLTIEVNKSPQVTLAQPAPVCELEAPFLLTGGQEQTGIGGTAVYLGNGTSADGFFNPAMAGAGTHPIQYVFTSVAGCVAKALNTIGVLPSPQVSAGPDRTLVAGGAIRLMAEASGNGIQYRWAPPDGLDDANKLQPLVRTQTNKTYRLTAISAEGCVAADSVAVTVVEDLYIPNAFTPNGDGLNDTWQVPFLESVSGGDVKIFNRYGQLVFQTDGTRKWDGRLNGAELPNGAYVYLLRYNGRTKKGTVVLIR